MCIIVCKPAGTALERKVWENCFDHNDDGAGIMYVKDKQLVVDKGYTNFEKLYEALTKLDDTDIVVHFRAASPGMVVSADNTHPFFWENGTQFSKDGKANRYQWAACHNGRLKWSHTASKSDTRCFTEEFLNPYTDRDPYLFGNKLGLLMFEQFIGDSNKIVVMRYDMEENETKLYIANESKGHWKNKCWFSNHSYEDRAVTNIPINGPYSEYGYYNYANNYGKHRRSLQDDVSWRKCWKEGQEHPPAFAGDIDKFGWFWSYQDGVWFNKETGIAVKELTYRKTPSPSYIATHKHIEAFENEIEAQVNNKQLTLLEGGIKDTAPQADAMEAEGGPSAIDDNDNLDHLEKQELAMICKRATAYFKELGYTKDELRQLGTAGKIKMFRDYVSEQYADTEPWMLDSDIMTFDLWLLGMIKSNKLTLANVHIN